MSSENPFLPDSPYHDAFEQWAAEGGLERFTQEQASEERRKTLTNARPVGSFQSVYFTPPLGVGRLTTKELVVSQDGKKPVEIRDFLDQQGLAWEQETLDFTYCHTGASVNGTLLQTRYRDQETGNIVAIINSEVTNVHRFADILGPMDSRWSCLDGTAKVSNHVLQGGRLEVKRRFQSPFRRR